MGILYDIIRIPESLTWEEDEEDNVDFGLVSTKHGSPSSVFSGADCLSQL